MNPDNEIIETEPEIVEQIEEPKPKKVKAQKPEIIIDNIVLPVLFMKNIACNGKQYKIHDIADIPKSELDKLPEKSYLVRKIRK